MRMSTLGFMCGLLLAAGQLPVVVCSLAYAAETRLGQHVESPVVVGLFEAVEAGQIEVRLIPRDAASGQLIVANKTRQPLTVKLPEAFAGVPVLAQGAVGLGGGPGNGENGGNANANQGFGGGFGGGGLGGGGQWGGGGGGVFNVPLGRAVKLKTVGVCLEHGKVDPNPRVAYALRPIESFTQDAAVIALVEMLGRGEIDQRAAQAAAWHLANGLSWQTLATKIGAKHLDGRTEPYFTAAELDRGLRIAGAAERRSEQARSASQPARQTQDQ